MVHVYISDSHAARLMPTRCIHTATFLMWLLIDCCLVISVTVLYLLLLPSSLSLFPNDNWLCVCCVFSSARHWSILYKDIRRSRKVKLCSLALFPGPIISPPVTLITYSAFQAASWASVNWNVLSRFV